ncbi:MAG: 5-carboxymethyl-2-hydroxymuconate isomerase [Sphingomonas sp.]|nr:5-carboxymethyl-2-hydroxymuconate isomerase [Sphingomonas sp.]
MAHVVVEWTDNLERDFDLSALLRLIAAEMRDHSQGAFPTGGIRVRGIRLSDYVIADGQGPYDAFINIEVLMGVGRPAEFKHAFFDQLFGRVKEFLGDLFDRRPLALSLYVFESEGWKHNSIHHRLKKA